MWFRLMENGRFRPEIPLRRLNGGRARAAFGSAPVPIFTDNAGRKARRIRRAEARALRGAALAEREPDAGSKPVTAQKVPFCEG